MDIREIEVKASASRIFCIFAANEKRQGFRLSSSKGGNHGDGPSYRATVRWIKDHLTHLRSGLNPSEMTACFLDAVIDIGIGNIACFFF